LVFDCGAAFDFASTEWRACLLRVNIRFGLNQTTIKSKHTLLITDACFSGSIFKTRSVEAAILKRFHEMYKDKSRKAMTSGNLTEAPDKSVFVKYLIKTLEENNEVFRLRIHCSQECMNPFLTMPPRYRRSV
jgi:hypothetical protein